MATLAPAPRIREFPIRQIHRNISLAEILSALSFALDLTEGAMPGHALRSCLLGMRLATELRLPPSRMAGLY
ncbi:MAG: hypothetical protein WBE72_20715, partial [Terracidiphilus sp.]